MQRKVAEDKPVVEITLRRFERPYGDLDELLRKFCISVGLLQPADSRDLIIGILKELLLAAKKKEFLTTDEIHVKIRGTKPNIRRHLRKMKDIGLVEKRENRYRIREFAKLSDVLKNHIKPFVIEPSFNRIVEYAEAIDSL